ncbi:MAG TPA: exopolysaccharide biosynthesis polyprenyl glycosylphosphotransferase [Chthoniobacteraceae bacterium]
MISYRTAGLHSLLVSIQIAFTLTLFVAIVLAFDLSGELRLDRYVVYGLVVTAALGLEFLRRDRLTIRTCLFERSLLKLHRIAFRQTVVVLFALGLFVTLLKDATLSRVLLGTFLLTLYPLLLLSNRFLPDWLAANIFLGLREHKTLLVGPATHLPQLQAWLKRKAAFGFRAVGVLCEGSGSVSVCGLPVLGTPEDAETIIQEHGVSQVIVLGLPSLVNAYSDLTKICNRLGARVMILSDLEQLLHHAVIHIEDDGLNFITLRQEPLESPLNRMLKRSLDILISLPVIVFVLPLACALVWICQRWQSPGVLFYRQTRAGIQNRKFQILKFRTMHPESDGIRQASKADDRIYPAGRWFRKLSIDELPQFWNVLRGEMSVVGPRPHLLEHNRQFALLLEQYHVRSFVRPGITGLAQVRGHRGEATKPEAITNRLEADTLYLENWSLFLDLGIIARTVWHVLVPPKTAY